MKRVLSLLLAVLMLFSLVGCGKSAEDKAKETADKFLKALEAGNLDEAVKYVDGTAKSEMETIQKSLDVASGINLGNYDADGSIAKLINDFTKKLIGDFFKSHTIGEIEKKDSEIIINVSMKTLDTTSVSSNVFDEKITTALTQEHLTELTKIYMEKGGEAMTAELFRYLFAYVNEHYTELISKAKETDMSLALHCIEKDGKTVITKIRD